MPLRLQAKTSEALTAEVTEFMLGTVDRRRHAWTVHLRYGIMPSRSTQIRNQRETFAAGRRGASGCWIGAVKTVHEVEDDADSPRADLTFSQKDRTMEVLDSHLDPQDPQFLANAAHNRALADELRSRLAQARSGGGELAQQRHREQGKLFVRARIDKLLDAGAPFLELSPLAAWGALMWRRWIARGEGQGGCAAERP